MQTADKVCSEPQTSSSVLIVKEYEDDTENVPRGTSVIVQRKPPSRGPGKGSAARYVTSNAIQVSARQEFKKPAASATTQSHTAPPKPVMPPVPGSAEDEAIRNMLLASSDQWQETQDRMALSKPVYRPGARGLPSGPIPDRPLPQGYICYRCGQKGHYIQACPTNGDEAFENRKRIKRTTGIPRSQLQKVEGAVDDGDGNVMINADGESVMFVPDSASWETYQKNTKTNPTDDLPEGSDLACGICKKILNNPQTVPCCGLDYCEDCIQTFLLDSDFICPSCGTKDILLDRLVPNTEKRQRIATFLEERKAVDASDTDDKSLQNHDTVENLGQTVVGDNEPGPSKQEMPVMPPFDPMMMGMMGFPGMGFPPMPVPGMPPFGFPPFLPNFGDGQAQTTPVARHSSHPQYANRMHPYAKPPAPSGNQP